MYIRKADCYKHNYTKTVGSKFTTEGIPTTKNYMYRKRQKTFDASTFSYTSLDAMLCFLEKLKDSIMDEANVSPDDVMVEFDTEDDVLEFVVKYSSIETDKEYKGRYNFVEQSKKKVEREKRQQKDAASKKEKSEYKQYLKLKKKFEDQ